MTSRLVSLARQQSLGLLALLVAVSGTAYAAGLPKNSVGSPQIKAGAVKSADVKDGSLLGKDFKAGQLPAGATGPAGPRGPAALSLSWRGQIGDPAQALGSIGPWTFSATCVANGVSGTRTALRITGADEVQDFIQISAFDSRNDTNETVFQTGTTVGTNTLEVLAADSENTGYGRQSGTVVLDDTVSRTGSIVVDLLAFAPVGESTPGACWVTGTVTLAEQ
jgi:hypothetical protein